MCKAAASLLLLWMLPLFGQTHPDFRQTAWGMTQAQVLATEASKPAGMSEAAGELIVRYDGVKLDGFNCSVLYSFVQDRLVRARYVIRVEHTEPDLNDFIGDYHAVEAALRIAQGQPENQKAVWQDDSLQEERISYLDQDRATPDDILPSDRNVGLAVSKGFLQLYTIWSTPRTGILHVMTGSGGSILHQIEFRSTAP